MSNINLLPSMQRTNIPREKSVAEQSRYKESQIVQQTTSLDRKTQLINSTRKREDQTSFLNTLNTAQTKFWTSRDVPFTVDNQDNKVKMQKSHITHEYNRHEVAPPFKQSTTTPFVPCDYKPTDPNEFFGGRKLCLKTGYECPDRINDSLRGQSLPPEYRHQKSWSEFTNQRRDYDLAAPWRQIDVPTYK